MFESHRGLCTVFDFSYITFCCQFSNFFPLGVYIRCTSFNELNKQDFIDSFYLFKNLIPCDKKKLSYPFYFIF